MTTKTKPVAQLPTTTEKAHEMMLRDIDRDLARVRADAEREIENHIIRLQRALDSIRLGNLPHSTECAVDDRTMIEKLSAAQTLTRTADNIRGWLRSVNA